MAQQLAARVRFVGGEGTQGPVVESFLALNNVKKTTWQQVDNKCKISKY